MNPSPPTSNGHLSRTEANNLTAAADVDDLAEVSSGADATSVRTLSHGHRTNGPELATDPDAGWYAREGDHEDTDAPVANSMRLSSAEQSEAKASGTGKKTSPRKYLFGYDAHLVEVLPALALGKNPARLPTGSRRPPQDQEVAGDPAPGGERPPRRTHHRRQAREPKTWTPTGHLAPAAQPGRPPRNNSTSPAAKRWPRP
ncbi:hypothetical protein [Streptomyces griseochromogenes]|uniref:hypothetical protein n=1 Tax=Streptomyces griseochromogenes TaxID=68214 RepID=UPI0037A28F6F